VLVFAVEPMAKRLGMPRVEAWEGRNA
jgi:hypothetical protein